MVSLMTASIAGIDIKMSQFFSFYKLFLFRSTLRDSNYNSIIITYEFYTDLNSIVLIFVNIGDIIYKQTIIK